MAFIELKNIDAGYVKGSPVLKDFNLSVEKGELISLLGPSGCGKTTTLRTIAGFILAEQGSVIIGGKDYTKIPPNKRNIGLVFQNYALFPHLSVFENVAYGLKRRKVDKSLIKTKVSAVLELVSLTGFEDRLPAQLSGGQRQRVALARSVVIEPDLLLLDEPLSNLDAKLRDEMRAELSRLQHQLGITMIYVTHDQIEALSLSSKIIVMNEGLIEQIGTPETIYERPATSFVAKFMGFDNSIKGKIESLDKKFFLINVDGKIIKAVRTEKTDLTTDENVSIFFRPEDSFLISKEEENSLPVSVNYSNFQGGSTRYSVTSGKTELSAEMPGKNNKMGKYEFIKILPEKLIIERVKA
ncbi:MAG: ABC transporter ATP-binding protein [Spirochaetia bacterium]|jgi:ABC-type Fe3+/spermidine/putrescine transport system ATPase subunit|nr:ABC transporter ATP-binding protein [Spirochaetia bacterium]